jgi:hypothetical protein
METKIKMGLSTMTKNQGCRLNEWITYHNNIGHSKFIIFLDECNDNSEDVLIELKSKGIDIDYFKTEEFNKSLLDLYWEQRSHKVYDYVIKNYDYLDWISFIEVDEFIFPQKETSLINFLDSLNSDCLYINSWDFKPPFNENKNILKQSYLCWSDELRYKSKYIFRGKSIIRPKKFMNCVDAHHFMKNDGKVSKEFKTPHNNFIQVNYGNEVTMDDTLFRIYHFRNHTDSDLNDYVKVDY